MITAMTHPRSERAPQTMRETHIGTGVLSADLGPGSVGDDQEIFNIVLQGVQFRGTAPLQPGSLRNLRTSSGEAKLASSVRVVSCRLRADGFFDITAEFF
jgi:hypothetical protein